ncbi:MAG: hypothetical protein NXH75_09325 [Halobacteriovoraceae bacterium]|nr:hypothetical protein [Halobacteriovoraceae bacterium]
MLQKNYSLAVVGKGYLCFLYGIELLRNKHSVLLLDDNRLEYGDLFTYGLTDLDLEFLKAWGADRDINTLKNIHEYTTSKPYTYVLGNKRVLLGGDPWNNLRELYRKFPNLFPFGHLFHEGSEKEGEKGNEESFLTDFRLLNHRLGSNGFRFKSLENNTVDYLLGQSPQSFKDLFLIFKNALRENKKEGWTFLYFVRSLFHKRLASSYSDPELFHFFLSLISPHYILDGESLSKDLTEVFIERGGHFKKTQVREWKFYRGLPWSMELASFEGIIHPHKISFLGSYPFGLPLKVKHGWKKFLSVHFRAKVEDSRISELKDQLVLCGDPKGLATDIPLWRLEVKDDEIIGQYFYREKPGSKLKFYEDFMKERLLENLNIWCPDISKNVHGLKLKPGKEVYLDQSYTYQSSALPKLKEVKLYDFSSPFLKNRLKNVNYFGPLKGLPLGLYGQLLEIKEISKYQ